MGDVGAANAERVAGRRRGRGRSFRPGAELVAAAEPSSSEGPALQRHSDALQPLPDISPARVKPLSTTRSAAGFEIRTPRR